jgi:hypothetical protein
MDVLLLRAHVLRECVYRAVAYQWVYTSQYYFFKIHSDVAAASKALASAMLVNLTAGLILESSCICHAGESYCWSDTGKLLHLPRW